ncbi:MAG: phosphatidylserine decarboxylase family protein [Candidatus Aureabacteria bacterium]|nr:phosphatidylserine decarboxylase family protein [Candidatus Auribacterota bacterium]
MKRYNIAREGMGFVLALIAFYILSFHMNWLQPSLAVLVILLFVSYFFRDPEIRISFKNESVISPGEGRVVRIDTREEDEFLRKKMTCISVFLSIFDVHVNYIPYDAVVEDLSYRKGKFINAMKDESSHANERMSLLLSTEKGKIVVRQIAGLIARRVVCHAKKGARLKKGERYGIIKFGSRVDVFLPESFKVTVKVGDSVLAGITEIAQAPEGGEAR